MKDVWHIFKPIYKSDLRRYGLVFALIVALLPFKLLLHHLFQDLVSFHLITFVVIISAWYGGFGPGILATILGGLLNQYFFIPPRNEFSINENLILTGLFFIEGFIISFLSEARKKADHKKDEFLAFASHELKNPLAVAKGYTDLLVKQVSTKQYHKLGDYTESIDNYINKTVNLINDLLDMTKIEVGSLSYQDESFKMADLIAVIVRDQQVMHLSHKLYLTSNSKKNVYGDKYRIGQVLINLISNAVKYSPNSNRVNIFIKDTREGVEISVQDFGIGIANEDQTKVFERYFRSHKEGNKKIEGLGIGLYITSEIVNRYKGKLWVKSKLNRGSTFYLFLPASKNK